MLFNNHKFFLFSQERPSLDRARDTDKMKAAIKAKMSRTSGSVFQAFTTVNFVQNCSKMKLEMPILRLFLICKKSKTKRHRQKSKGANEGLD